MPTCKRPNDPAILENRVGRPRLIDLTEVIGRRLLTEQHEPRAKDKVGDWQNCLVRHAETRDSFDGCVGYEKFTSSNNKPPTGSNTRNSRASGTTRVSSGIC